MSSSLFPGGDVVAGGVTKPTGLWQGEHAQNISKKLSFFLLYSDLFLKNPTYLVFSIRIPLIPIFSFFVCLSTCHTDAFFRSSYKALLFERVCFYSSYTGGIQFLEYSYNMYFPRR